MLHSRLLRYLDEVAGCGSIRKAAEVLNVAPSAISRQIIALEQELGAVLFERMPGRIRLTSAGQILIAHARETLKEHQRARDQIDDLKGTRNASVAIATTGGLASELVATAISQFRLGYASSRFLVRVLSPHEVVAAVTAGEADLGVAFDLPAAPHTTVVASVSTGLGAAVVPTHTLATKRSLRLADLQAYPLILPTTGVRLRALFDHACASAGLVISPTYESNSFELLKRLTLLGQGVAILNGIDSDELRRRGLLSFVPITDPPLPEQSLMIIQRMRGSPEPLAGLIIRTLKEIMERVVSSEADT